MLPVVFGFSSAFFAAVSAVFWARSAQVNFRFGEDSDEALNDAMRKSGKLNGIAASCTSIAAVCSAIAIAFTFFGY